MAANWTLPLSLHGEAVMGEALERVADAVYAEMDNRGLLKDVDDDLFDEIKLAVARAAVAALRIEDGTSVAWIFNKILDETLAAEIPPRPDD